VTQPSDIQITRAIDNLSTGAAESAQTPERLKQLAQQFESVLMAQMLREMRSSIFDDEKDTGFASGPLSDTLFSELSLALSRAGGLGLGQSLAGPLARQADVATPQAVTTDLPVVAPEMMLPAAHSFRLDGPVSSGFGWRRDPLDGTMKFHKGIDVAMPVGTDVQAVRAGNVTFAGTMAGYGLTVVVDHGDGLASRYAHLSEIDVKAGDAVQEGQVVARSGATGRVTGPHLHFEMLAGGLAVDPVVTY
jgi:murein DD-endopeptidase MepM/ murein hydrolase activator NlpD